MKEANLVLYLFDVAGTSVEELQNTIPELERTGKYILVGNKMDSLEETALLARFSINKDLLFISAQKGLYMDVLKSRMLDAVLQDNLLTENVVVTNARHYQALAEVNQALNEVLDGLENSLPGDLLALDIRRCLHYLGAITGEITNEDQLDYIFSKFCIGK